MVLQPSWREMYETQALFFEARGFEWDYRKHRKRAESILGGLAVSDSPEDAEHAAFLTEELAMPSSRYFRDYGDVVETPASSFDN